MWYNVYAKIPLDIQEFSIAKFKITINYYSDNNRWEHRVHLYI